MTIRSSPRRKKRPSRPIVPNVPTGRRRASQRQRTIGIDLSADVLRALMTEQCRDGSDWITVYSGTRAQLIAAGVPEVAFPESAPTSEFKALHKTSKSETSVTAVMRATDIGFELEIYWEGAAPRYTRASHPAIDELARMVLLDVSHWTSRSWQPGGVDLEEPLSKLAEDERSEYRPTLGARRVQVTAEFNDELGRRANQLFEWVRANCEVLPSADPVKSAPVLRLVHAQGAPS